MVITTLFERIFTIVSVIITGGFLICALQARSTMLKHARNFQYDFAYEYSQIRTSCIIRLMGSLVITMVCAENFWDGISLLRLIIHGIFNLELIVLLGNMCSLLYKMDKIFTCEESMKAKNKTESKDS